MSWAGADTGPWDPVENASLLPWLTATALLHTMVVQRSRGQFKGINAALIALTFLLTIFGTWLTRSGVIQSVHSFAKSEVGVFLLVFLVLTAGASAVLLLSRWKVLRPERGPAPWTAHEWTFFTAAGLLMLMMLFTALGTIRPLLSEATGEARMSVDPEFYNRYVAELFGLLLVALMALGPLLTYGRKLASWVVPALILGGAAAAMLAWYTPTEATMGPIQKIFYLHLPVAINTMLACTVVFVGSVGYLWHRHMAWDDLASAAAKVAVLAGLVVLVTGMIWARSAWGVWWTWSPRLTFTLMLWLLYVVYVIVRSAVQSPERRALVSAVYGIVAFLDVPLAYFTAKLMPDIHPASIELSASMKLTLAVWFVLVTMLCAGLVFARYRLNARERALAADPEWAPSGAAKPNVVEA